MSTDPTSTDEPTPEPAPDATSTESVATERWTYGGLRRGRGGRKLGLWRDPNGRNLYFKHESRHAPGTDYEVRVTRTDGNVTMHGNPQLLGRCEDEELRAKLMATDRAVRAEYEVERRVKQYKQDDPLTQACDKVAAILAQVPTPQRSYVVNYAYERIAREAWR